MNIYTHKTSRTFAWSLPLAALLMSFAGQVSAATYQLCAGQVSKTMPDGKVVWMWGYGLDGASCTPTVPGPHLVVPAGDNNLTISLRNTLGQPVSIMIPGLATAESPAFFNDAQGRSRVRSLVHETAPGTTSSYSFSAKPGTYLYQSGTHSAVQVQMGLYGAVTSDAAAGQAYSGVSYDNEVVMLYSELDPAMHDAVAGAVADDPATTVDETIPTYGTAAGPTSMIGYHARYFLVNGEPYTAATADIVAGNTGTRTLIRFLNAGLETHAPMLQGQHLSLVAEYGNAYPYPRSRYSTLLSAGQTRDAIFTPMATGRYPLWDRRLRLTNNTMSGLGGMMSVLAVGAATPVNPPVANDDAAATIEDTPTVINVASNDTDDTGLNLASISVTQPVNGVATANADGTVGYTPNANFNGNDSFTYTIDDIDGNTSNSALVLVAVDPVNDAPVASNDAYAAVQDTVLSVNAASGLLANDSDVDGDALTASLVTAPVTGNVVIAADGSFVYTPAAGFTGDDIFTYNASDGVASSTATVTITVSAPSNQPPVAQDDYMSVTRNTGATNNSVTYFVLANDSDPDGTIDATTLTIVAAPLHGTATVNLDGSITYIPKAGYAGSDALGYTVNDNQGATSNTATVRIDVVR